MQTILEQETRKYTKAWQMVYNDQNTCGATHVNSFLEYFPINKQSTILDIGCGSGNAVRSLHRRGYNAHGIDLVETDYIKDIPFSQSSVWEFSGPDYDYVLCTDVLEHVPSEMLHESLQRIQKHTRLGAMFVVSTREDHAGKSIGEILHLTVQPIKWWIELLSKYFRVETVEKLQDSDFRMFVSQSSSG
jgi:2-polyprenyl-3-methyl-5-hydroxy-6-metoxy-1,4-benzoquinol methylase